MRVLVVEDDPRIASFMVEGLKQSGYAVDHCGDGESGRDYALRTPYDAAIIDLMLPKLDGLSLIGEVRARKQVLPILILSAKTEVEDRVRGLETGADDYLTKPFALVELLARLSALIRRANHPAEQYLFAAGDLQLDLLKREVTRAGKEIELQRREFALLEYLLRNPGRVITKMMILDHVWDYSFDPQTNVVDVLVYRLRQKIDKGFEPKLIQTLRGSGYVLGAS
ncbi:MAG: response regulator transcription factor [Verrucomicrobiota bacterium]|nr:response regulator transcription factor [Verrucomicrobiota bacterium]